jgi:NADH/F420H2 dehydrogenase subunit C
MKKKFFLSNFKNIFPYVLLSDKNNEISVIISPSTLLFSITCLKKHINFRYNLLSCISGIDYLNTNYRFGIIYDLLSLNFNTRIRVKTYVNEVNYVDSIVSIFINANWWEREVWDLYGIYFYKHPDLRRILTDYGFEGYPMRKDFPLSGYVELRYDQTKKRIVLESVELAQEFRYFTFETPW